jgi:hypothetical protein
MPALAGLGAAARKIAVTAPNSATAGHFIRLLRGKSTTATPQPALEGTQL